MIPRAIRNGTYDGQMLVEFAIKVMQGGYNARMADRLRAMEWLADRGWGKAPQDVRLIGDETKPLYIVRGTPPLVIDGEVVQGEEAGE